MIHLAQTAGGIVGRGDWHAARIRGGVGTIITL